MHDCGRIWTFLALAALVACGAPPERVGAWGDSLTTAGRGGAETGAAGAMGTAGEGGAAGTAGAAGSLGGTGGSRSGGAPGGGGGGGSSMSGGAGGNAAGGTGGTVASGGAGGQVTGGMGGTVNTGGSGTGGATGTGGTASMADNARFNFESGIQQWSDLTRSRIATHTDVPPIRSTVRRFAGLASLEYSISTSAAEERVVGVVAANIGALPAGATVTYRLWVPADHKFDNVQAFVQTFTAGSWHQDFRPGTALQKDAWNQFSLVVPSTYAGQDPLELGLFFRVSGAWSGKVWIDSVDVK